MFRVISTGRDTTPRRRNPKLRPGRPQSTASLGVLTPIRAMTPAPWRRCRSAFERHENRRTARATTPDPCDFPKMQILAISGSLRAASTNSTVLRAMQRMAGAGHADVDFVLYDGVDRLPHYSPDLDPDDAPQSVPAEAQRLRCAIADCNALVICSPEYAHGVPGSLKNLLDWLVGSADLAGTPVALIDAAPHSRFVQPQLTETLSMLNTRVIPGSPFVVALTSRKLDEDAMLADAEVDAALGAALQAIVAGATSG